ncbi:hypothetical protein PENSPDRAFT_655125 [Peniophora sp. CONT]|nr:hypothetical protein PENSPDRAFT_655125 [Peniophora sp. CONT]
MSPSISAFSLSLFTFAGYAAAQGSVPKTPLASLSYPRPSDLPYKVDPSHLSRGPQSGYNICNSTTEGPESLCQTSYVNDLSDFCLWGPAKPNSVIGDAEGEVVAWCSKAGHGTRVMPPGTLQGVQLLKAPDYVMITGMINQTLIDIKADDDGGELDPHGQDLRGNPIGGMMYSTQFSGGTGPMQVIEWTNFMGSMQFCIKICDPKGPAGNPAGFCQHTLDRCSYNAPSKYTVGGNVKAGEFETCESDNMRIPGEYVAGGQTLSYKQPAEGVPATPPYQPSVPSSSKCTTTASAALYTDAAATSTTTTAPASGSATGSASRTGSNAASATPSATGSASASSQSGAASLTATFSFAAMMFGVMLSLMMA